MIYCYPFLHRVVKNALTLAHNGRVGGRRASRVASQGGAHGWIYLFKATF
jgi:predicted glutamine amidotransferase